MKRVLILACVGVVTVLACNRTPTSPSTVPSGSTLILSGNVTEAGLGPLAGAIVAIIEGPNAGQTTTSNSGGAYAFFGVSGTLTVQVSMFGYVAESQTIAVNGNQTLNFALKPETPSVDVSGVYTLTLTASTRCSAELPADATVRSYTATLTQTGDRVDAVLSGADFYAYSGVSGRANRFSGKVSGIAVRFTIGADDYYGFYDVLERLDATRYFTFSGTATTTASPASLSGTLAGPLKVTAAPGFFARLGTCSADDHVFVLTPGPGVLGVARQSAHSAT